MKVALLAVLLSGCGLFRPIDDPVLASDSGGVLSDDALTIPDSTPGVDSVVEDATEDTATILDTRADVAACAAEGTVACTGARLQRCTGGKLITVEECATPELCDATGSGSCKTPTCAAGEKRCIGKLVERCNTARTAFAAESTCELACGAGECLTIVNVSAGGAHSCAAMSNGTVRCWGENKYGQLGTGTTDDKTTPTEVSGLTSVVQVVAGEEHTCARLSDGSLKCWGSNFFNQIGDGVATPASRFSPVTLPGITDAADVALGTAQSCVLHKDGAVSCWGQFTKQTTPSAVIGTHTAPYKIAISDVTRIAVGSYHTCAVKKDGTLWCWWGANQNGELGDGTTNPSEIPIKASVAGVKEVGCGNRVTCALLTDGTVRCAGKLNAAVPKAYGSTPVAISGLTDVASLRAREATVCAIRSLGDMKCWGSNEYGQLADGTKTDRPSPVDATALGTLVSAKTLVLGYYHTLLHDYGGASGVGDNSAGQLGNGKVGGDHTSPAAVVW